MSSHNADRAFVPDVGDRVITTRDPTVIAIAYMGLIGTVREREGDGLELHGYKVAFDEPVPTNVSSDVTLDISMLLPWVDPVLDTIEQVEAWLNE